MQSPPVNSKALLPGNEISICMAKNAKKQFPQPELTVFFPVELRPPRSAGPFFDARVGFAFSLLAALHFRQIIASGV